MKPIVSAIIIIALMPSFTALYADKTVSERHRAELAEKLNKIKRNDRQKLDTFTSSIRHQGTSRITALVEIWKTGDDDMAWKAAYILGRLGDMATDPLLKAGPPADPRRQAWRIKKLAESPGKFKKAVISELVKQLDNKTYIPAPGNESFMEDPPPEQRICDAAYLHLRELLNTKENNDARLNSVCIFRRLEIEDRDLIIKKYQTGGIWIDLVKWEAERNNSAY